MLRTEMANDHFLQRQITKDSSIYSTISRQYNVFTVIFGEVIRLCLAGIAIQTRLGDVRIG